MTVKMMAPDQLVPYALNVKQHKDDQVEKIAKSIEKFGWRGNPIVIDDEGVILAGHGRRLAAIKLGLKQVPVEVVTNLSEDEKRAYRLADNRVAISDIDTDMFREELSTLNFDLGGMFDEKEIDFSMADLGTMVDTNIVLDLSAAVDAQETATHEKVEELKGKRIPLHKVLGFKDIAGADQIHLTRFIALVEEQTGLKGDQAFVAFCKQVAA